MAILRFLRGIAIIQNAKSLIIRECYLKTMAIPSPKWRMAIEWCCVLPNQNTY